jgi:hypothetical protein
VTATRGKAGGYRLAQAAAEIRLVDAVRALDGPILEMPCGTPTNLEVCARPQDCSVHAVFERLHDSLEGALGDLSRPMWPPARAARRIPPPCGGATTPPRTPLPPPRSRRPDRPRRTDKEPVTTA